MRILILGINFYPEAVGTGKYTGEMAMWLAARGHEVRVVTAPPHNPQWRVLPEWNSWAYSEERIPIKGARISGASLPLPAEIRVFRCPLWVPTSPNGIRRLAYLLSFGLSSWPAMLRQANWRPQLVLLVEPTLFCAVQALVLKLCSGAKAWLHVQDFEVDAAFELGDFSSSWIRRAALTVERALLRRFDRVSAISDRMVDRLMRKGVEPSRCIHFPNWVDTRQICPLSAPSRFRRELGIDDRTTIAMYSGSMGKKQGLDLLVEAAKRLSHREDLHFVFCGEGSYRQAFAQKAKDLPNVSLLPLQPPNRLNDLLNLADIHLLPQRADAADLVMPSKLTGILASGRPVVATADPGTQLERAVAGHGLVVPPADLDAFASAILQLTVDADLRSRLGQEARKYSLAHLDFDGILLKFEQAILSICNSDDHNRTERTGTTKELTMQQYESPSAESRRELAIADTHKLDH